MGCWHSSQRHLKALAVGQEVAGKAAYTDAEGLVPAMDCCRAAHPLAALDLCHGLPALQVGGCPQFEVLHPEILRLPGEELDVGDCGGAGPR